MQISYKTKFGVYFFAITEASEFVVTMTSSEIFCLKVRMPMDRVQKKLICAEKVYATYVVRSSGAAFVVILL